MFSSNFNVQALLFYYSKQPSLKGDLPLQSHCHHFNMFNFIRFSSTSLKCTRMSWSCYAGSLGISHQAGHSWDLHKLYAIIVRKNLKKGNIETSLSVGQVYHPVSFGTRVSLEITKHAVVASSSLNSHPLNLSALVCRAARIISIILTI